MKITVIVPVYGVEEYLDKCVSSITNQTYRDLEIFLIDDGGKDRCPQMCDEWGKRDQRIKVIHKENGGQGTARNAALDCMTGDYVLFVDSDDTICPDMVEKMVAATDNGRIDGVLCGYMVKSDLRLSRVPWYSGEKIFSNDEIMLEYLTAKKINTGPVCKLISKDVMRSIRFPDFRANEDAYIMHEILGGCKTVAVVNEHLYVQYLREGSTERAQFNEHKMHLIDCAISLREYVQEKYPRYYVHVKKEVAVACLVLLRKLYGERAEERFPEIERSLREILSEEIGVLEDADEIYNEAYMCLHDLPRYRRFLEKRERKAKIKRYIKSVLVKVKKGLCRR